MGIQIHEHQVPEPWSGRIDTAPILFVSSNPSISTLDVYPTQRWQDDELVDFFNNRFGAGQKEWIRNGNKGLARDGTYLRATAFWSAVRRRAEELLQRTAKPGVDYALTEIVHCKSRREIGVRDALEFCSERYFEPILLALSASRLIVVLGKLAETTVRSRFGIKSTAAVHGPLDCYGRERMVAFLPHPNARGVRSFEKCISPAELRHLQQYLNLAF